MKPKLIPFKPIIDPGLITSLERALQEAKDGKIRSMILVYLDDRKVAIRTKYKDHTETWYSIIGAVENCLFDLQLWLRE